MDKKAKPYGIIEQEILFTKGLSMRGKLLYCALKTYVNDGVLAFPKQEVLAEGLDISERTIIRAIKDLVDAGLIEKHKNWKLNNYTILSSDKYSPDKPKIDTSSDKYSPDQVTNLHPTIEHYQKNTTSKEKKRTKPRREITPPRKQPNPLHKPCREIFEKFHNENFTFKYKWNYVKDGPNLNTLIKNLQNHIKDTGGGGEFEDIFLHFLNIAIKDKWVSDNFTVSVLMSQTTQILNKHAGKKSRYDPVEHAALVAEIEKQMES